MKFVKIAAVALVAAAFAGCGGQGPKAPKGTVRAVYVDLQAAMGGIEDVIDDFTGELPASKNELKNLVREKVKNFKKDMKESGCPLSNLRWFMSCDVVDNMQGLLSERDALSLPTSTSAPRLRNTKNANIYGVKKGEKILEYMKNNPKIFGAITNTEELAGVKVYEGRLPDFSSLARIDFEDGFKKENFADGTATVGLRFRETRFALVGDDIFVASSDRSVLEDAIRIYKGDSKPEEGFDDIDDLDGNTVARFLVPNLGGLVKKSGLENAVKTMADNTGDKKLAESILDMGDFQVDINLDGGDFGAKVSVTCASRADARFLESRFKLVERGSRWQVNESIIEARDGDRKRYSSLDLPGPANYFLDAFGGVRLPSDVCVAVLKESRESCEADRSGRTATFEFSMDTEDTVEKIVKSLFN